MKTKIVSKVYLNPVSIAILVILCDISYILFALAIIDHFVMLGLIAVAVFMAFSIHIADKWEKQ